jgi:DNA repair protein RecO (recombination protein O)
MRAELHPAYILHRRRYRETSLLLESISAEHGRVGIIARGAMRARKRGGDPMQAFQPYKLAWSGRAELRSLVKIEPAGRALQLTGERLFSGFYVNELTMRMTTRQDPNPDLYLIYERTLQALALPTTGIEPVLRLFERTLLDACGYGLQLLYDANSGNEIEPDCHYRYLVDEGPVIANDDEHGLIVSGQTLLAIAGRSEFDSRAQMESKKLMRFVLQHYIGTRPLASRSLFRKSESNDSASNSETQPSTE